MTFLQERLCGDGKPAGGQSCGYMCVLVQGFWTLNWFGKTLVRKESLPQVASYGGRMGGEWKGAVVE